MKTISIKIKRLDDVSGEITNELLTPTYGHYGDACFDIKAIENVIIAPGEIKVMRSGLAFQIPFGYEMQVRPRSGLSFKHGIMVPNSPATIDATYTGELKVALINMGKHDVNISVGDRFAQATVKEITQANFEFVEKLHKTDRGANGFGSTGK